MKDRIVAAWRVLRGELIAVPRAVYTFPTTWTDGTTTTTITSFIDTGGKAS